MLTGQSSTGQQGDIVRKSRVEGKKCAGVVFARVLFIARHGEVESCGLCAALHILEQPAQPSFVLVPRGVRNLLILFDSSRAALRLNQYVQV